MISLLKSFGKGILYVIGAPFFVLILAIFAVIGLFEFIFQLIKSIIFFFTGQKFFPELEEDKELRLVMERNNLRNSYQEEPIIIDKKEEEIISPIKEETTAPIREEIVPKEEVFIEQKEVNKEPILLKEELPQEEIANEEINEEPIKEENLFEENNIAPSYIEKEEEIVLETNEKDNANNEIEEEEILETYVPRSSSYSEDIDEDDTEIGVDIDYDL